MSSKLLNQRASEDEASRGASPVTASSDEDSRAMIGLIAAAAASVPPAAAAASADSTSTPPTKATKAGKKKKAKATPVKEAAVLADLASSASGKSPARQQQHQLPMFLSKTYHMISRCDPDVATWSASGDSFIIKNVEQFSSTILPQYFKHSNFSSFARQLNFYGFRKLKSDPICLADADDRTSTYVSFFHQNFQKDRPDLLQSIKRATKSEQQTKEENDSLRTEIASLRSTMASMQAETNQKIAALTDRFNQQIAALQGENRALFMAMQPFMAGGAAAAAPAAVAPPLTVATTATDAGSSNLMQSLGAVASAAMTGMKRDSTDITGDHATKKSRQQ